MNEVDKTDAVQAQFYREEYARMKAENAILHLELRKLTEALELACAELGAVLSQLPSVRRGTQPTGGRDDGDEEPRREDGGGDERS